MGVLGIAPTCLLGTEGMPSPLLRPAHGRGPMFILVLPSRAHSLLARKARCRPRWPHAAYVHTYLGTAQHHLAPGMPHVVALVGLTMHA
ncbi:hypothetical protein V6N12_068354 [Hibiscus sabdariffa]|uniref:Uncharacterized protein n=1 Tax=Hibiscus sabdariffa TaxID=183260 RepID=A0ABR2FQG4_9ROSI